MSEKLVGYMLLAVGLVIIALAALSVYSVFNGSGNPINLFDFPPVSLPASSLVSGAPSAINNLPDVELLSAETLNQTANTAAHLFLMGFMVTVGGKVASLGTYMLRPIVIKTKEENVQKTS